MCLFKYKVKIWAESDGCEREVCGIVISESSNSFDKAASSLMVSYGSDLVSITHLEPITDYGVIECREELVDEIKENWIW